MNTQSNQDIETLFFDTFKKESKKEYITPYSNKHLVKCDYKKFNKAYNKLLYDLRIDKI